MKKIKVCFLADKHGLYDDRIYWKMAISLIQRDYEIYYLLIGEKEESGITKEGVHYFSYKVESFSSNRYFNYLVKYNRPKTNYTKLLEKAKEINADVYHFHDLHINNIGKRLKSLPQKPIVIYDARDPFAVNIKDYIGGKSKIKWLVNSYADYIDKWEKKCAKNYDMVISNEENVANLFKEVLPAEKVAVIYNYTYLHQFRKETSKKYDLIYCGGITEVRGAIQIIEAIKLLKDEFPSITMLFLGPIFSRALANKMASLIEQYELNNHIILKDKVPYHEVISYYNKSKIGLGIFLPIETHKITLQIKIFEYMAMGLPIIGSNFGHIKKYILENDAGIPVDPTKPKEIAKAIKELLQNNYPLRAAQKKMALMQYHKSIIGALMEKKLFSIYDTLIAQRETPIIDGK